MRSVGLWCLLVFIILACAAGRSRAGTMTERTGYARGRELFAGRVDLQGRVQSHPVNLPPEVVRCANCHAVARGPEVPRSLAPRLTRELLMERRSRRGGPPSSYTADSFCALLQTGVDPAFILISEEMPRYEMDAGSCHALWLFLTWRPNGAGTH